VSNDLQVKVLGIKPGRSVYAYNKPLPAEEENIHNYIKIQGAKICDST
jgi:hypothetical protein